MILTIDDLPIPGDPEIIQALALILGMLAQDPPLFGGGGCFFLPSIHTLCQSLSQVEKLVQTS